MAIIAHNIVITNKTESVPKIVHQDEVHLMVPARPVVTITANVAVVQHPDYVDKPSDYVSRMFHSHK